MTKAQKLFLLRAVVTGLAAGTITGLVIENRYSRARIIDLQKDNIKLLNNTMIVMNELTPMQYQSIPQMVLDDIRFRGMTLMSVWEDQQDD